MLLLAFHFPLSSTRDLTKSVPINSRANWAPSWTYNLDFHIRPTSFKPSAAVGKGLQRARLGSWIKYIHIAVFSQNASCQTRTFIYLALFQVWTEEERFSRVLSIRSSTHTQRFSTEEWRAAPGPHCLQTHSKEHSKEQSLRHSEALTMKFDTLLFKHITKGVVFPTIITHQSESLNMTEPVRAGQRISGQHIIGAVPQILCIKYSAI